MGRFFRYPLHHERNKIFRSGRLGTRRNCGKSAIVSPAAWGSLPIARFASGNQKIQSPRSTAAARTLPFQLTRQCVGFPIDNQEVWAAGVTYKRSQTARMEESEAAASCYDRVYEADRPELSSRPHRIGSAVISKPLRIRKDATWNVPEPEITLVLSPQLRIIWTHDRQRYELPRYRG